MALIRPRRPSRNSRITSSEKLAIALLRLRRQEEHAAADTAGRGRLADFIRLGWHVLEPTTDLEWNWHIEAIADHIQAAFEDWITRQRDPTFSLRYQNLLINVPPGTGKSRIVSVYAPAWMWLHWPTWKVICFSSNPRVALRDSEFCRLVIESDWYRDTFRPGWHLSRDQNAKGHYRNTAGGSRLSLGFTARIVGDRADCLLVDDPHDPDSATSDTQRNSVLNRWDASISNRVNDLRCSLRIGVMQRVHERDWSGHILDQGGWEHLCIPQEYEPERARTTALGWHDPRTEPGQLLFPERFTPTVLETEKAKGSYFFAGQHQQRPAPASGGIFQTGKIAILPARPGNHLVRKRIRYWDKAASEGKGDYSAGVLLAMLSDGRWVVEDVVRGRWSAGQREAILKQTAQLDGPTVEVWIEQEPGSSGVESAQATIRNLAGFAVWADKVTGDKVTRARPAAAQMEAGNIAIVQAPWNRAFLDELAIFNNGNHDDQVDGFSGAFNKLAAANLGSAAAAGTRPSLTDRLGFSGPVR